MDKSSEKCHKTRTRNTKTESTKTPNANSVTTHPPPSLGVRLTSLLSTDLLILLSHSNLPPLHTLPFPHSLQAHKSSLRSALTARFARFRHSSSSRVDVVPQPTPDNQH